MSHLRFVKVLVFVVMAGAGGCATMYPGMRAEVFANGQPDPDRDVAVAKAAEKMDETPADVEIYSGKIPEGLDVSEGGAKISVAQGYESQYQILGTVESDYTKEMGSAIWKNFFWTWNYKETWRKALCWPQAPLKALTLSLWAWFMPAAYPCFAVAPGDEPGRQKAHLVQLKKLASAMGGNLVVLTNSGDLTVTTVNADTGQTVGRSVTKNMALRGFAIKYTPPAVSQGGLGLVGRAPRDEEPKPAASVGGASAGTSQPGAANQRSARKKPRAPRSPAP